MSLPSIGDQQALLRESIGLLASYSWQGSVPLESTALGEPDDGMTTVHGSSSDPVVLRIESASSIPREVFDALNECCAFVNWRRMEVGEPAILALSYWLTDPRRR